MVGSSSVRDVRVGEGAQQPAQLRKEDRFDLLLEQQRRRAAGQRQRAPGAGAAKPQPTGEEAMRALARQWEVALPPGQSGIDRQRLLQIAGARNTEPELRAAATRLARDRAAFGHLDKAGGAGRDGRISEADLAAAIGRTPPTAEERRHIYGLINQWDALVGGGQLERTAHGFYDRTGTRPEAPYGGRETLNIGTLQDAALSRFRLEGAALDGVIDRNDIAALATPILLDKIRASGDDAIDRTLDRLQANDRFSALPAVVQATILMQIKEFPNEKTAVNMERMLAQDWFAAMSPEDQRRAARIIAWAGVHRGDRDILDNTLERVLGPEAVMDFKFEDLGAGTGGIARRAGEHGPNNEAVIDRQDVRAEFRSMSLSRNEQYFAADALPHEVNHVLNTLLRGVSPGAHTGLRGFMNEYRAHYVGQSAYLGGPPNNAQMLERVKLLIANPDGIYEHLRGPFGVDLVMQRSVTDFLAGGLGMRFPDRMPTLERAEKIRELLRADRPGQERILSAYGADPTVLDAPATRPIQTPLDTGNRLLNER